MHLPGLLHQFRRTLDTKLWDISLVIKHRLGPLHESTWRKNRLVRKLTNFESQLQRDKSENPKHLHWFEASKHSQNGEDGIIAEIFSRIGTRSRFFVEIGAADGVENCTAALLEENWQGIWVEGDSEKVLAARELSIGKKVKVCQAYVDRDMILPLLDEEDIPREIDLFVLDIDGNDYWILKEIGTNLRPRVMVLEYNAKVGPNLHWVMAYNPEHTWDQTSLHGASLAAFVSLAADLGFTLVGCDSLGVNAFFVRTEEAGPFMGGGARKHWVPPRYRLPYGHPDPMDTLINLAEPFTAPPIAESENQLIKCVYNFPESRSAFPGGFIYFNVEIFNGSTVAIGECLPTPTRVAAWWIDKDGNKIGDEQRSLQEWRAAPGSSVHLVGQVRAPLVIGSYFLEVSMVQENVRWMTGTQKSVGQWNVFKPQGLQ